MGMWALHIHPSAIVHQAPWLRPCACPLRACLPCRVCVWLQVPFFHHELVKQALVMALDQPARSAQLVGLLAK